LIDENVESKTDIEDDHNSCEKESLSRTILSLDSPAAKQNALQHVLNALRINLSRDIVLAALMPPSEGKLYIYWFWQNSKYFKFSDVNINHEVTQSDQGGGEAPAPVLEVNNLHLVHKYI